MKYILSGLLALAIICGINTNSYGLFTEEGGTGLVTWTEEDAGQTTSGRQFLTPVIFSSSVYLPEGAGQITGAGSGSGLDADLLDGHHYSEITTSTASLQTQIDALEVSTGTLQADLATEVSNRGIADTAIYVSTGTNQANIVLIGGTTQYLQDQVDLKVAKAGDTMTGTLNGTDVSLTYGVSAATGVFSGNVTADDFVIPDQLLGSCPYYTINDFCNSFGSAGRKTGGAITDAGSQQINISSGTGFIKALDDDNTQLTFCCWDALSGVTVATNTVMYVGVDYNSGTPIISTRTLQDWDYDTEFPLGSVINQSSVLYINNDPWWVTDGVTNIIQRFQSEGTIRDDYVGGLILGTSGTNTTRKPTLTAGVVWSRLNEFDISDKDCSGTDTFTGFFRDGAGGWLSTGTKTDINDYYDDNSGELQPLDNNKYVVFYVFTEIDTAGSGKLMLIYPQTQYVSSSLAEAEQTPVFPSIWYKHGILVGRIIIKQGVTAPVSIETAFETNFGYALAADHGNLSGLSDDDHPQYAFRTAVGVSTGTNQANIELLDGSTQYLQSQIDNISASTQAPTSLYSATGTWTAMQNFDDINVTGISTFTAKVICDRVVLSSDVAEGTPTKDTLYTNSIIKGGINFDGTGTISIRESFNVASIADGGTGIYTVSWDVDFAHSSYTVVACCGDFDSTSAGLITTVNTLLPGSTVINVYEPTTPAAWDADLITVIAIGDQ